MPTSTPVRVALGALVAFSCQPIIIGNPYEQAGAPSIATTSGSSAGGSAGVTNASGAGGKHTGGTANGGGNDAGEAGASGGEAGASDLPPCVEGSLTLKGHIASMRGAPIIGATVELSGVADATTTTDASGNYAFERLCPGRYQVAPLCTANTASVFLKRSVQRDFVGIVGGCDPDALRSKVLLVVYDPTMNVAEPAAVQLSTTLGVGPPGDLALGLFDALLAATHGHVRLETATSLPRMDFPPMVDGFRYDASSYAACLADSANCHPGDADYGALSAEVGICAAVETSAAEEIWLIGGDHFGFASKPLDCQVMEDGKQITKRLDVVGMTYGAGSSSMLAGFKQHSVAAIESVSGVSAPTIVSAGSEPYAAWFSALPRAKWLDEQGHFNDFWRYVLRPEERLPLATTTTTCSTNYLPGWCQHVNDKIHGECNSSEWATYQQPTGWVEYLFQPAALVSGVALYDRACVEQVTSGHLEFSDGSENIAFGALEPTGTEFKSITFKPRRITGMRVVIDTSTTTDMGPNPGFGEITVAAEE